MQMSWLAVVVGIWNLALWGGRIALLSGAETTDPETWIRIAGSVSIALAVVVVLVIGTKLPAVLWTYVGWNLAVWLTSVASVWATSSDMTFRLVHTALAIGSVLVAAAVGFRAWSWRWSGQDPHSG